MKAAEEGVFEDRGYWSCAREREKGRGTGMAEMEGYMCWIRGDGSGLNRKQRNQ